MIKKAKTAKIKNSKIDSDEIIIEDGAIITNVTIKAKRIHIGKDSSLIDCKLFTDGDISIGKNTALKEGVVINAFEGIKIGDRVIIDREVIIGGMQSETSKITIGNDSVVLYRSYLNVTKRISIGNNVGIGGYCLIFTHSSWQNVLDGNPFKFADVIIGDNVWLPWHVIIFPGVCIGKDVTIGGGSIVTKSLPSKTFAAGVPAKVIYKKQVGNLSIKEKDMIIKDILDDFVIYAKKFLKLRISSIKTYGNQIIKSDSGNLVYSINFKNIPKESILISFKIPTKIKQKNQWIELDTLSTNSKDKLANQFIIFVKRYGIRIH